MQKQRNQMGSLLVRMQANITTREIILFVVITSFGLLIVGGLVYKYLKRQTRIQIAQHQHDEIIADNSRNNMHLKLSEEGNNSVYDIIDESAMSKTLEPFTFRTQNSYLDVTYGPNSLMNVKDNLGISCLPGISSLSQLVQMTNLRSQRYGLEESVITHQGALLRAYSDGYLMPSSFKHHTEINKMITQQGALFSKTDSMTQKEYGRHIYDEPADDGIGRENNYDRLIFSKDKNNLRNENETKQLGINIKPLKYTTCSPKRNTV
ncbi:Hypothetical predicted protein [Mytilus galloprovincialis]|uniref:Uncharacterized protein n=1 Tax=Mytilus galloprovincialis TaxID=29158 RepID=A0A8B6CEB3_MYTGA|nr:Hypothetical predicted protein [Mytilus galloprovincialis]